MTETTKEKRIKAELNRIKEKFSDADANQKAIVAPLMQNAAFMKVTLEDLQEIINLEGVTDSYQNGVNQYGVKQSATLQSYNSLIKNYTAVIKALSKLLPPEKKEPARPWQPREKTPEEIAEEQRKEEEHIAKINADIQRAVEFQRRQREAEKQKIAM